MKLERFFIRLVEILKSHWCLSRRKFIKLFFFPLNLLLGSYGLKLSLVTVRKRFQDKCAINSQCLPMKSHCLQCYVCFSKIVLKISRVLKELCCFNSDVLEFSFSWHATNLKAVLFLLLQMYMSLTKKCIWYAAFKLNSYDSMILNPPFAGLFVVSVSSSASSVEMPVEKLISAGIICTSLLFRVVPCSFYILGCKADLYFIGIAMSVWGSVMCS